MIVRLALRSQVSSTADLHDDQYPHRQPHPNRGSALTERSACALDQYSRSHINLPESWIGINDRQAESALSNRPPQNAHGPDNKDDERHDPLQGRFVFSYRTNGTAHDDIRLTEQ